ncbi:MAG: Fic family protein [Patescibacteria group bacterium]
MDIQEKLLLLQQLSGLSQDALARRLGVSFAAYNRWVNGRARPRAQAVRKIDALFAQHAGLHIVSDSTRSPKVQLLSARRKAHPRPLKVIQAHPDIRDAFLLALTFHTNRIEGSTLTEAETAAILFAQGRSPRKSVIEQLEAKNHQAALEYMFTYVAKGKPISEAFILRCHEILLNAIRDDAGMYRNHPVRIVGSNIPTANYLKVPARMSELVKKIQRKAKSEIISHAAAVHAEFEQIHPFADGNGRVGRLLMHAMLLKAHFPPAVITQQKRGQYMKALQRAQQDDEMGPLVDVSADAVLKGYLILERKA